jgi:hypothetical protein
MDEILVFCELWHSVLPYPLILKQSFKGQSSLGYRFNLHNWKLQTVNFRFERSGRCMAHTSISATCQHFHRDAHSERSGTAQFAMQANCLALAIKMHQGQHAVVPQFGSQSYLCSLRDFDATRNANIWCLLRAVVQLTAMRVCAHTFTIVPSGSERLARSRQPPPFYVTLFTNYAYSIHLCLSVMILYTRIHCDKRYNIPQNSIAQDTV